jgi:tetratricopeptide (TPR) repeat protein
MLLFSQTSFEKADRLFSQEKYAAAKPIYESILNDNLTNLKVIENLGDIEIHLKNWDKAIFYYQSLKKLKYQKLI